MLSCWAHEEECDNKIGSSFFFFFFFSISLFFFFFFLKLKFEKSLKKILCHIFFLFFIYFFENKFIHLDEIGC